MVSSLCVVSGTPALTSRTMKEADMDQVAAFIDEGVQIAAEVKAEVIKAGGSKNVSQKVYICVSF